MVTRGFQIAMCLVVLGAAIVTPSWAQVYPVRWEPDRKQPAPAPVPKTGQTTSYAAGDDGDLRKGVPWPIPRFTDNSDGTVTDNLTGLIWLQDASCDGLAGPNGRGSWGAALSDANALASGVCGLSDGSIAGDWRLPNRFELQSLVAPNFRNPALSNARGTAKWREGDAFTGVVSSNSGSLLTVYWSSTTFAYGTGKYVWRVHSFSGYVAPDFKSGLSYVWPVRDDPLVVRGRRVAESPAAAASASGLVARPGRQRAPVRATGQTRTYATGDDGDLRKGVPWPIPRFTDNADGTVTDNLTGLIWLQDASCDDLAGINGNAQGDWGTALSAANLLASGVCGLSDGSIAGDWRLPNRFELESLVAPKFSKPTLPNAEGTAKWSEGDAFSGVRSAGYWSSTPWYHAINPRAWYVWFAYGQTWAEYQFRSYYIWPVRGGQ